MSLLQPPNLSRGQRFAALLVLYLAVLSSATWLAYGLRFDFAVPLNHQRHVIEIWVWVWASKLLALAVAGQFSSLLSFFSLPDLKRLGLALGVVTFGLFGQWYAVDVVGEMSRGVIVLDGILSFLGLAACRLGFRLVRQGTGSRGVQQAGTCVAIVGAGEVGAALARELQSKATLRPVVFFDDAKRKHGTQIHGVPVVGAVEDLRESNGGNVFGVDEVIIAMPSAPGARVREVVELLDELGLRCRTVPSMSQLAVGDMVTALRPVEIVDVLGRESVDLGMETVREFLEGKTVLVTGAGGSIGSELCRQLAHLGPTKLVLVERSEFQLFEIYSEIGSAIKAIPELIDVQDTPAMVAALERHSPDVIFHAAAFKHVALMERQPGVAIRNNVLATHRLAAEAAKHGAGRFILISTDKAVMPSCVMGATKALAERVLQGHALEGSATRFISVRFGNVLGSSGSVVPIFQKQIELGGPVTVTDAAVTRFFMSIPEAAGLVLRSAAMGTGGDRFILDMGEPVRIAELAEDMIRLTGREPGTDIAIEFIGLRPGEKLHEELHTADEQLTNTDHPKIQRITGAALTATDWRVLETALQRGGNFDDDAARAWLCELLPNYKPTSSE